MKKKLLLVLGMSMIIACVTACGANPASNEGEKAQNTTAEETKTETPAEDAPKAEDADTVEIMTYEFETFDGETVVIDENNIFSQEANDNPLEWDAIPEGAEQIAPGRDCIIFEDEYRYFVEDVTNNLVTIASKDPVEVSADDGEETFSNGTISFDYYPSIFAVMDDGNSVIASFIDENVEAAGSNVVEITVIPNADADAIIDEYINQYGIADENISDIDSFNGKEVTGKILTTGIAEAEGSELKTSDTAFIMQDGDNVVSIEVFRTIGPDEGTEMYIDDEIAIIFETLNF